MRSVGLMLAFAGLASAVSASNHSAQYGGYSSGGTPYTPPQLTPEELAERNKGNNDGQLHRFVIRGREVWARNKKDAFKKASKP